MAEPEPTCYRHPDRRTLVRCSNCDRPICTQCMIPAPVGQRCPECAGRTMRQRVVRPRAAGGMAQPRVTVALIVLNVIAFAAERGGDQLSYAYLHGALYGPAVADGDWWRIVTSGFLHANVAHILFNMFALWWMGNALERYIGSLRLALIYFISLLSGSAGALLLDPNVPTIGASGAVFGLLGALLVLERQGIQLTGPVLPILAINVVFTFAYPNISKGGHAGGLIGGLLVALALQRFGRGHVAYGRITGVTLAALAAIVAIDLGLIVYAV
jgi:membrane associated rhomboid family serine protease